VHQLCAVTVAIAITRANVTYDVRPSDDDDDDDDATHKHRPFDSMCPSGRTN